MVDQIKGYMLIIITKIRDIIINILILMKLLFIFYFLIIAIICKADIFIRVFKSIL